MMKTIFSVFHDLGIILYFIAMIMFGLTRIIKRKVSQRKYRNTEISSLLIYPYFFWILL
jgi:hypothetical protein